MDDAWITAGASGAFAKLGASNFGAGDSGIDETTGVVFGIGGRLLAFGACAALAAAAAGHAGVLAGFAA